MAALGTAALPERLVCLRHVPLPSGRVCATAASAVTGEPVVPRLDRRRWACGCCAVAAAAAASRWAGALGASWAAAAQALAAGPRRQVAVPQGGDLQLWGYYPWWMREDWQRRRIGLYDRLCFFEMAVGDDGQLLDTHGWPQRWQGLAAAMRSGGGRLDVTIFLSDAARFERVFGSGERRARLLTQVLELLRTADGVNLDVEIYSALTAGARRGYSDFCTALATGLSRLPGGKTLSVFGVMGAVVDLYERPLQALIDHVVVQGYDSHHAESRRAGPVAPLRGSYALTWERALQQYLALGWPRRKLLFGLPFYGYEWPTVSGEPGASTRGQGRHISYAPVDERLLPQIRVNARAEAQRHGLQRDPASGSPFYVYRDLGGPWRQGWFEDETSLAAKLAFVGEEGLAGAAVFPVGYDDGAFDALLQRHFKAG